MSIEVNQEQIVRKVHAEFLVKYPQHEQLLNVNQEEIVRKVHAEFLEKHPEHEQLLNEVLEKRLSEIASIS